MAWNRNYIGVARDLDSVTRIDRANECPPEHAGLTNEAVDAIWRAVQGFYRTATHPAITVALRRRGRLVMHRAIGHARGNEPGADGRHWVPATPETPICLFSASKAITALLVHKLVEDGCLSLDERVAPYIPEYAQRGKDRTTVRQLLSHRAGIPTVPDKNLDYRVIYDWDAVLRMLCAAKPFEATGERQAYHAITGGFILGELVRRVGGTSLHDALRQWIAEPLGCRTLTYGLAPELRAVAAPNVFTGPRPPWMLDLVARRVLGANFRDVVRISNEEEFLTRPIPAGNIFATADDAGRVFQMLLDGGTWRGRRVFQPETVAEIVRPVGKRQFDGMLVIPVRFSAGMMLGDGPVGLFGPASKRAFGHIGFLNIVCWADPVRDISVAILNNGKTIAPSSLTRLARVINAICKACVPTTEARAADAALSAG
ncbi:MAG: class beta-lactamase-related serine hydrolase [Panacagrimonas sp.]|nr:serine hydrolase domain-containing protein [Panacagrimonas sp.]MCC2655402.1 class beta-lactamase-related serine hydrolase [Panacagrimonas sp.]